MARTVCYVSYSLLLIKQMPQRLRAQRNSASECTSKGNVGDSVNFLTTLSESQAT